MSTALEQANRKAKARKIHPIAHRDLIITERNKQLLALKRRLRVTETVARLYRETLQQIGYGRHPSYKRLARATLAFCETQTAARFAANSPSEE